MPSAASTSISNLFGSTFKLESNVCVSVEGSTGEELLLLSFSAFTVVMLPSTVSYVSSGFKSVSKV